MLLSPEDLIKRMVQVYRAHYTSLLRYVGVTVGLFLVLGVLFIIGLLAFVGFNFSDSRDLDLMGLFESLITPSFIALILVFLVAAILLDTWLGVAIVRTTSRAVLNEEKISITKEMKQSASLVWKSLGSSLLGGIIAAGPIILALLLWSIVRFVGFSGGNLINYLITLLGVYGFFHLVYFGFKFVFASFAVSIDHSPVVESLKKSSSMMQDRWWAVVGRLFCAGLVLVIPYYLFSFLAEIDGFGGIFFGLVTAVYYIGVLLPMSFIPAVILYHEIKKIHGHK